MNKNIYAKILILLVISFSTLAAKKGITIDVNLSPAGSFQIQSKLKGHVYEKGGSYYSKGLYTQVKKMKTGMDLRDDHTKKKLEYEKYPKIEIVKAQAKGGKGLAIIKIRSIKKKVAFTYKKLSAKYIEAIFNISLKDFKFEGVNYMGVGVQDKVKVTAIVPVK